METLVYFSLNRKTAVNFHKYVKANRFNYHQSFQLISLRESRFYHISDLACFLSRQQSLSHIKIIIDYVSLTCPIGNETIKEGQEAIRRLILQYPEVFFLFDETGHDDKLYNFDFSDFLLPSCEDLVNKFLYKEYHQFNAKESNPFLVFENARSNLFDGSNLRYVIKRYLYGDIKVGKHNFGIIQSSRAKNLALCVEEEDGQSRFNSYSLFSNGYRVLPVLSASELKHFNEIHDELKPAIITRDFDLQFDDIKQSPLSSDINEVDKVRGYKYNEEQHTWTILTEKNAYWNNFVEKYPIMFVTKGPEQLSVDAINPSVELRDGEKTLYVQGIRKPVPGIYTSFQKLPYISETASKVFTYFNRKWLIRREAAYRVLHKEYVRLADELKKAENANGYQQKIDGVIKLYENIIKMYEDDSPLQYRVRRSTQEKDYIWLHQIYSLKTGRANHDHGVPLNVYDMVKKMVDRAKSYYEDKKYIRASIVSWEAIEVMNGFHEILTLEAYHVYALSDNAIAMSVLGGEEEALTTDTRFRVKKIRADINRLLYRHQDNDERRKFAMNALNQIFSDCRAFCKQKEHFNSEEVFISAMGHLNDSDPTYSFILKNLGIIRDWALEYIYKCKLTKL